MSVRDFELTSYGFTIDKHTLALAVLFVIVTSSSTVLALEIAATGQQPVETPQNVDGAAAGAGWAVLEVLVAIGLLAILFAYRKFPEWLQELVKWNAALAIPLYLGHSAGKGGSSVGIVLAFYMTVLTIYKLSNEFNVWWVFNNLFSLVYAVLGAVVIATVLSVEALVVAFLLLTVYDHIFANKQTWMFDLGKTMLKYRVPAVFVAPSTWRFDWDDLADSMGDDRDEEQNESHQVVYWGIGTADLMIPAAFAAAIVANAPQPTPDTATLAFSAVVAGIVIACGRLRYELEHQGSGAGLPALAGGVLGAYLVAQVVLTVNRVIA